MASPEKLPGFEEAAGDVWIYPTNSTVRDYQFDIVRTALFHNTLVSLPTGLGKTFIAAVVMYNYNRWYPNDIVVFMAPTRPLVTQQLKACHNIGGILAQDTVELTGKIPPNKRKELWKTKKVFFLTPQVMASDLSKETCPASKVRCIVVDEAHKAMGNHAYVQVISAVAAQQSPTFFRVLALSATPGSDIFAVQQVFKNLMISRVELRSEDSPDILPYTHQNCLEKIVVKLSDHLKWCFDSLLEVFQLYTGKLMKRNVISGRSGASFVQYQLINLREKYRENPPPGIPVYEKGYIEADFATSISLAKALELLEMHGICSSYTFMKGIFDKERGNATVAAEFRRNENIKTLLKFMQEKLNISIGNTSLNNSALFTTFPNSNLNGSSHNVTEEGKEIDYLSSHPKMGVLKSIVVKHFESFATKGESTRIMVFSQYRDSVEEIGAMLNTLRPLVKPMTFVGQSKSGGGKAGLNQKNQAVVLQDFRSGGYNVLVATSVGEEGLDIGEVDLIICYDSCGSPTRLIQRMGRTGRKRQGKTIFLLTEGKEEAKYMRSNSMHKSISKNITDSSKFEPFLYQNSPRMIPIGIDPVCFKMRIVLSSERGDYTEEPKNGTTKAPKSNKLTKKSKLGDKILGSNAKLNPPLLFPKLTKSKGNECILSAPMPNEADNEVEVVELDVENFCVEATNLDVDDKNFHHGLYSIDDCAQRYGPCLYICMPFTTGLTSDDPCQNESDEENEIENPPVHEDPMVKLLREEIETLVLVGSIDGKCKCGNGNTHLSGDCFVSSLGSENAAKNNQPPQQTVNPQQFRYEVSKPGVSHSSNVNTNSNLGADLWSDDNDPFDDGDDNWIHELNEPGINNSNKNYEVGSSKLSQRQPIQCQNKAIEVPPDKFEMMEYSDKGNQKIKHNKVEGESQAEKDGDQVRYTRRQMYELFEDDEILFEEEDDYANSDEERKHDSNKSKSSKGQNTTGHPVRQSDKSNTGSADMFSELNLSAVNHDITTDFFESKPRIQSTPKKLEFKTTGEEVNGFPEAMENFPSSPDLSQFRLENQIKNPAVSQCLFKKYEDIMSPDNMSADLLNGYVTSMRLKNSKCDSLLNKQESSSCYPKCKPIGTLSARDDSRLNDQSIMNETVEDLKPKKKFVFKKRSPGAGVSSDLVNTNNAISPVPQSTKPSCLFVDKDCGNKSMKTEQGTCPSAPRETASSTRSCFPKSKNGVPIIPRINPGSSLGRISDVTDGDRNISPGGKNVGLAEDDKKSLREGIRQYQMQYCSEDMMDPDFDDHSWMTSEDVLHKKMDKEKRQIKDIIEKKRLQAIEVRNRKRQEEQLLLQEIKPVNYEIPKPVNPFGFKEHSLEQSKIPTLSPGFSNAKQNRENVPNSSSNPSEWGKGSKRKLNQPSFPMSEFSDDDDFDFVKPQRKVQKSKERDEVSIPVAHVESKEVTPKKKFNFTLTKKRMPKDPDALPRPLIEHHKSPNCNLASIPEESDDEDDFSSSNKPFKRNQRRLNPFVDLEAEVSGDSSDGCADEVSGDNQDEFDYSFVTQNFDDTVTHSQHARYVESLKDVLPIQIGGNKKPLSPKICGGVDNVDYDESYYEGDSFCVSNDEVDYSDVGVFTQAMQKAKHDLEKEEDDGGGKRLTRKGRKETSGSYKGSAKRRRRVVAIEDSSDED